MSTILACAGDHVAPDLAIPGSRVIVIEDLCHNLHRLSEFVDDAETELLLVLHRTRTDLGGVQAAVRRIGFDPLGVGLVHLETIGSPDDVEPALRAALARCSSFTGAPPETVKMLPADRSTRRGLLSIGKPRYIGAPMVHATACAADAGCRACVSECPEGALSWTRGVVDHDINTCVSCGICVTTCPTGAVENPTATPTAIENEIRAAIDSADGRVGIRLTCRDGVTPAEPGWYQVQVPCTGMLTVGWILAPAVMGASAVDVVSCSTAGCRLHNDDRLTATLLDVATLADALGFDLNPVRGVEVSDRGVRGLLGPGSSARVLDILAASRDTVVSLGVADVGSVTIDEASCTACERCAQACPTSALSSGVGADQGVEINFDPTSCVACGSCVAVCPEATRGAIDLRRVFDGSDRRQGVRTVRRDETVECELCGRPVAPAAMLAQIEARLGAEGASTMAMIARRCLNCRGR